MLYKWWKPICLCLMLCCANLIVLHHNRLKLWPNINTTAVLWIPRLVPAALFLLTHHAWCCVNGLTFGCLLWTCDHDFGALVALPVYWIIFWWGNDEASTWFSDNWFNAMLCVSEVANGLQFVARNVACIDPMTWKFSSWASLDV